MRHAVGWFAMWVCATSYICSIFFESILSLAVTLLVLAGSHLNRCVHVLLSSVTVHPNLFPQFILFARMSSIVCAGCNHPFTHAGYSCHLSMTKRASCHALYDGHLDRSAVHHSLGIVGPEGKPGEYC
jgi:hypothetical protein